MASDCIFCQIVRQESPAQVIYRDDLVTAFRDINPQAPEHILVVPNEHIPDITHLTAEQEQLAGALLRVAARIAADQGLATSDEGFRIVINYGEKAGLTVPHLHVHLLGGRRMSWPPG